MLIKKFNTGIYNVNTYLLYDETAKEAILIDIGGACPEAEKIIKEKNLNLKYILNTHGHFDHISGEKYFQEHYNVPIYAHKNDLFMIENLESILNLYGFPPAQPPKVTDFLTETTKLLLGEKEIQTIETPGHTQGSVCFLIDNNLFSGDTLFYEAIGRTDLPGGSFEKIQNSIKEKLFKLPDNTNVYAGHEQPTTIGHEKLNNFFVR